MHSSIDGPRVVGTKQTLKALNEGKATWLYIAKDAKPDIVEEVINLAKTQDITVTYVDSMKQLGKACNIEVKTATVALIKH